MNSFKSNDWIFAGGFAWQYYLHAAAYHGIVDKKCSARCQGFLLPVCRPWSLSFKFCHRARTFRSSFSLRRTRFHHAITVLELERQIRTRYESCSQVASIDIVFIWWMFISLFKNLYCVARTKLTKFKSRFSLWVPIIVLSHSKSHLAYLSSSFMYALFLLFLKFISLLQPFSLYLIL